jgi:hypothetical protein
VHARHIVGRHVRAARLQQVEQDDWRERRRHSSAHELAQVKEALVVGVRRARDDDARRVSETAREGVFNEVPQPARKDAAFEMHVGRGRRARGSAGHHWAEASGPDDFDGN